MLTKLKSAPAYLLTLSVVSLGLTALSATAAEVFSYDPSAKGKVQPANSPVAKARKARYPKRGMTMKQVRRLYGEPRSVRKSTGKVKKKWPRITVWNYAGFSVYFERHTTLHTVVH